MRAAARRAHPHVALLTCQLTERANLCEALTPSEGLAKKTHRRPFGEQFHPQCFFTENLAESETLGVRRLFPPVRRTSHPGSLLPRAVTLPNGDPTPAVGHAGQISGKEPDLCPSGTPCRGGLPGAYAPSSRASRQWNARLSLQASPSELLASSTVIRSVFSARFLSWLFF